MSQFSGKCDFYDSIVEIHCDGDTNKLGEFLSSADIRIRGADGREHRVMCTNEKEAVKYYPYIISIGVFNKDTGTIVLSSQSFIDSEEQEFIQWHIDDAFKYWRKCKRDKKPFDVDEYIDKVLWFTNKDVDREIATRIAKNGNKATFDDIHDSMHEYFRRKWFEEMVRVGWNEYIAFNWCFNEFFPNDNVIEKRLGRNIQR